MRYPTGKRRFGWIPLLLLACSGFAGSVGTALEIVSAPVTGVALKQGHSGSVSAIAFTRDGTLVTVSGSHSEVLHWDPQKRLLKHGCFAPLPSRRVMLSPRGRWLVALAETAPNRGAVTLHDSRTGAEVARLEGRLDPYAHLVFSEGEEWLAAARSHPEAEPEIAVWKAATGKLVRTLAVGKGRVVSVALRPDGGRLAASVYLERGSEIRLWNLRTGESEAPLASRGGGLQFSPDGEHLVVGSGELHHWNLTTRTSRPLLDDREYGSFGTATFSPDGKELAMVVSYPTRSLTVGLAVLRLDGGEAFVPALGRRHGVGMVRPVYSPDGKWLAAAHGSEVMLWDRVTRQRVPLPDAQGKPVWSVALSPDGRVLATSSYDRTTRLWDPATGELKKTLPVPAQALAFSHDGRWLGLAGDQVQLYDVRAGTLLPPLGKAPGTPDALAFSPDGKWLAVGSAYDAPRIWNVATRAAGPPLSGRSAALVFSPDGSILAAAGLEDSGTVLQVWSTRTWASPRRLPVHQGARPALAFSPDGRTLVSGGDLDHQLRAWDTRDWSSIRKLEELPRSAQTLRYLPDGKTVAVLTWQFDTEIFLWEPRTGVRKRTLFQSRELSARTMELSRDGKRLFLGTLDGSILVLDVTTGRQLATLHPAASENGAGESGWVAFTPEGYYAASPGAESFLFWKVDGKLQSPSELQAQFRRPDRLRAALQGK